MPHYFVMKIICRYNYCVKVVISCRISRALLLNKVLSNFLGQVLICLFVGWSLSGCQVENSTVAHTVTPTPSIEPTSIILVYRSPVPSATDIPTPVLTPTPDPGVDDLPGYYGGLVVTLDDVGKTLTMRTRGGFLLRLGEEFQWIVTVTPPDIITLNEKVSLGPGEQGVFIARKKGRAVIQAVGEPICRKFDTPCTLPTVLFRMNVLVE